MPTFRRIICAIDFEPCSDQALNYAGQLAGEFGAALILVHVYDAPVYAYSGVPFMPIVDDLGPALEKVARAALDGVVETVKSRVADTRGVLRRGRAWEEILLAVKEAEGDLVVIGTHGRHGLPHALMGSVAEKVVRLSPIPVLTVRRSTAV